MPIPDLGPDGLLPVGRHAASLPEIHTHFVLPFTGSRTRSEVWEGFLDYLSSWDEAEHAIGVEVLRGVWIGGSFTSAVVNPSDIDVSPIYEQTAMSDLTGTPGIGDLKRLFAHRERVRDSYKVEPFPVPWLPIASTLYPKRLTPAERDTLAVRGGVDAWWGRARPSGPRTAPVPPTTLADRGYLEVILR